MLMIGNMKSMHKHIQSGYGVITHHDIIGSKTFGHQ